METDTKGGVMEALDNDPRFIELKRLLKFQRPERTALLQTKLEGEDDNTGKD